MFLELPVLDYCISVWISAAASHFGVLDRIVSKAVRLCNASVVCTLHHRRRVAALCIFYKIHCYPNHH